MKLLITSILLLVSVMSFAQVPNTSAVSDTVAYSQGTTAVGVARTKGVTFQANLTVTTATAGNFTCAITDICTKASHGFYTGLKAALTTTTTLPAGLTVADWYVIRLSANTFSLASSSALAQAGTAIDITDTGTGTHTITPAALGGASVKIQGSLDGTNWADLPIKATGDLTKSGTVTATANFILGESDLAVNFVRLYYTMTAGQILYSQRYKVHP
jgi:hypothetical protein